jgi:hypothetical protein
MGFRFSSVVDGLLTMLETLGSIHSTPKQMIDRQNQFESKIYLINVAASVL